MFNTNADMVNGFYGKWIVDKDGNQKFLSLGKEIVVNSISCNIETGSVKLRLSFNYQGETVCTTINRADIGDPKLMAVLAGLGADVTKKNFDVVIDTIRMQEADLEARGVAVECEYENVGWTGLTLPDGRHRFCYRAHELIGEMEAKYAGDLDIWQTGSFNAWKSMVETKVLGHPVLELALLVSLAAVVNGLICDLTTGENPIVHLCSRSGTGKTTAGILAASVFGEPFDGKKAITDSDGITKNFRSVYGTWGATPNATITQCAGNCGCVIVLNELGKFTGPDMAPIVYNLSEGTDKQRLTKDLRCNLSEGFHTTILSLGEFPILDRCKTKAEGLHVRVLEIDDPVTETAEQADEIKQTCRKNSGHAAAMLAQYIVEHGGRKAVLNTYNEERKALLAEWPDTPSKERFVSKFPALFLATARIAETALGITFDYEGIKEYLKKFDGRRGGERNTSASSYDFIVEQCAIHKQNFFVKSRKTSYRQDIENNIPSREIWGRITYETYKHEGRTVVQEIEIIKSILENLLLEGRFQNRKACVDEWKKAGVLDYEDKYHATRSRRIDPSSPTGSRQEVYVFRMFATAEGEQEILEEENRKKLLLRPTKFSGSLTEEDKIDGESTNNAESA